MSENGHTANGHNGRNGLQDIITKASPYVGRRQRQEEARPEDETTAQSKKAEQNEAEDDRTLRESEPKNDGRRRLRFAAFLAVALAGVATVLYLKFGQTTKIDYLVKAKPKASGLLEQSGQPGQQGPKGQQPAEETAGSNSQVEAAIAQMREARRAGGESKSEVGGAAPDVSAAATSAPPLSLPNDYIAPRPERSEGAGGAISTDGGQQNPQRAQGRTMGQPRHETSSVYADEAKSISAPPVPVAPKRVEPPSPGARAVALPAFGAMLPIRMLGGVVTLRNSIARMELTQDVKGEGWVLKRGTVFVAQSAGGAFDRAYLNVSGFIDPATNRLVKLSGEVLGDDATQGLKGKRRQMSGRWSRAFNRALSIGPGIAQAALARNGGTTVIVPTGGATSELLPSGGNSDRREFVEVRAGAVGYVLVTDLPDQIKGVDSDPTKYLAEASATKNAQSELSESELAELLVNGTPAKIKEAMPRMSPEMRRVAALAIGEPEK